MKHDGSHLVDAAVPLLAGIVIAVGVGVRADASTRPLALTLGLAAAAVLPLRRRRSSDFPTGLREEVPLVEP